MFVCCLIVDSCCLLFVCLSCSLWFFVCPCWLPVGFFGLFLCVCCVCLLFGGVLFLLFVVVGFAGVGCCCCVLMLVVCV